MIRVRLRALLTIAVYTFREAVRQKFFGLLIILAIGFTLGSNFFRHFDFGGSELKFISDFGWGALFFFGTILSVVGTSQLFFNEIENRTAMTLLAKPVTRFDFLAGKFLGMVALLAIFTVTLVVLLMAIMKSREVALGVTSGSLESVNYTGFIFMGCLQFLKFTLVSVITLFIATFSNTNLYSVILSFFMTLICQLQYVARDYWGAIELLPLRYLALVVARIFPNFQVFNAADSLLFHGDSMLPGITLIQIVLYAIVYTLFFGILSVWSFKLREL